MTAFPVVEKKKRVRRFTCCEHGVHPRQCTKCQIEAFEKVSLNSLTKDVRGLLCGIVAAAPVEKLYCCRCETGFHIMTIEELNNNSCCLYSAGSIHAKKCDCRIFFVGNRVLIVADEFSDYGDDGYALTAGIFADPASAVTLSSKQATRIYGLQEKAVVCDHCIDFMLDTGELNPGGGVNEQLR